MGLEAKTTAKTGTMEVSGRLHLDSKQLEFSSRGFKWSAALGATLQAQARKNWLVWPKGVDEIRQSDVMETAAGEKFGPSKTASFDDHHSSMRFARKRTQ